LNNTFQWPKGNVSAVVSPSSQEKTERVQGRVSRSFSTGRREKKQKPKKNKKHPKTTNNTHHTNKTPTVACLILSLKALQFPLASREFLFQRRKPSCTSTTDYCQ